MTDLTLMLIATPFLFALLNKIKGWPVSKQELFVFPAYAIWCGLLGLETGMDTLTLTYYVFACTLGYLVFRQWLEPMIAATAGQGSWNDYWQPWGCEFKSVSVHSNHRSWYPRNIYYSLGWKVIDFFVGANPNMLGSYDQKKLIKIGLVGGAYRGMATLAWGVLLLPISPLSLVACLSGLAFGYIHYICGIGGPWGLQWLRGRAEILTGATIITLNTILPLEVLW